MPCHYIGLKNDWKLVCITCQEFIEFEAIGLIILQAAYS